MTKAQEIADLCMINEEFARQTAEELVAARKEIQRLNEVLRSVFMAPNWIAAVEKAAEALADKG